MECQEGCARVDRPRVETENEFVRTGARLGQSGRWEGKDATPIEHRYIAVPHKLNAGMLGVNFRFISSNPSHQTPIDLFRWVLD